MDDPKTHPSAELMAVLTALRAFAAERKQWPDERRPQLEAEFGDLLMYVVRLADQLGLDAFAAADKVLNATRKRD